ncbi:MAG: bifunctional alpha,alpha-trehalose-phosphate synthase (UDP-forming)/trehalose-phosphatase, partial [Bacteroidales bacterium]|nr:bifunctional alpha,alpha-trehalose-phosphate synthase (UDP-forming)/trehalose-phosphatase [Bacteroidales bacterium]
MKLFIIANRLPVKAQKITNGHFEFTRSEGGLATGLASLELDVEMHWIGWPGIFIEDSQEKKDVRDQLEAMNFHPVFLTVSQIRNYYEGYSNSTLWPLCHYFYTFVEYENLYWETYKEVNTLFSRKTAEIAAPGDIVWIHDYQLMLVPQMLRNLSQSLNIGYFLHIPFPSYELFRILPERAEILNGLLGADLIAFHTHDYMRHFISTVERVMGLHFDLDKVLYSNRVVQVDSIPMGINFELYNNAILNPEIKKKADQFRSEYGKHKLILSVDRLDYSKGIMHRLKGFARFIEDNPGYHEKVSLVMVVVPSRSNVRRYAKLKKSIDEAIGSMNGKYSTIHWTPIYYFYYGFQFEELVALYHIADIALVSPLRDGMNLVAKEYVAAKRDSPGVLVLSEMAGASAQLSDALTINPNDVNQISESLRSAMEMPVEQQLISMQRMRESVAFHTVNRWADLFINQLLTIRRKNIENDMKRMTGDNVKKICKAYRNSKNRLLILDYDGTLSPFRNRPR